MQPTARLLSRPAKRTFCLCLRPASQQHNITSNSNTRNPNHQPSRPFSISARRRVEDPASDVADAISPSTNSTPPPASIPSRTPSSPADDTNRALRGQPSLIQPTNNKAYDTSSPQPRTSSFSHFLGPRLSPSKPKPTRSNADGQDLRIGGLLSEADKRARASNSRRREALRNAEARQTLDRIKSMERQQRRIWREGDVYAPHDLSAAEQIKALRARSSRSNMMSERDINTRSRGQPDLVDRLGINPLKEYKNFAVMGEFMSVMGRIRHRKETGLRAKNQRKMAKAVRRAIALGLMPSVHRHPEFHPARLAERGQTAGFVRFDAF